MSRHRKQGCLIAEPLDQRTMKVTDRTIIPLIEQLEKSTGFIGNGRVDVWTSDVKNRDCFSSNREEDAITIDDQMSNRNTEFSSE